MTRLALHNTYRIEVLLPVTSSDHIIPCGEALEYLSLQFPDGGTISRAAPPASADLAEGMPAWSGFYKDAEAGTVERDAHILFLAHWLRFDIAESELWRRVAAMETHIYRVYARHAWAVALRDVYQVEIFLQVTPSYLALLSDPERGDRRLEKSLLPERAHGS